MSFLRIIARAAPARPFVQLQAPRLALQPLARARLPPRAFFAAAAGGLRKEEIEARILDIVKSFEKVEPGNVSRKQSSSSPDGKFAPIFWHRTSQSLTLYFSPLNR
jgi:hypothetical protein